MDKPFRAGLEVNRIARAHTGWRPDNVVPKVSVNVDRADAFATDRIHTVIVLTAPDLAVSGGGKFYLSRYRHRRDDLFFFDDEISQGGFQISNTGGRRLALRLDGSNPDRLDERFESRQDPEFYCHRQCVLLSRGGRLELKRRADFYMTRTQYAGSLCLHRQIAARVRTCHN